MAQQISIAMPYHGNRSHYVVRLLAAIHDDDRINDVTIVDDASDDTLFRKLETVCEPYSKVRLFRNDKNKFVFRNKLEAVDRAIGPMVAVFDSDNCMDSRYLDAFFAAVTPHWNYCYLPVMAMPEFDYTEFAGDLITKQNVTEYLQKPMGRVLLNCMNCVVNRDYYLHCHELERKRLYDPRTADSLYINYLLLKHGGVLNIVPGMVYEHNVHAESTYRVFKMEAMRECARVERYLNQLV